MHDLGAQALVDGQKLGGCCVQPLLARRLRLGPGEFLGRHEVGQANGRNPVERRLVREVDALHARLPPEALQRGHYEIVVAVDAVVAHFRHLDGIGDGVQHADGLLVGAALHVGVALAAHGHKGHGRHGHQLRSAFRQVELFVFLLEIERHGSSFRCKGELADSAMLPQAAGRILAKGVRLRRASHLRVSFASTSSDDRGGCLGDRVAASLPSAQSATAPCQLAVRKASSASLLLRWSET